LDTWLGLGLSAAVGAPLVLWRWKFPGKLARPLPPLARGVLAVLLSLWSLLVVYHRAYDAMVMIVFLGLVAYLAKRPEGWTLSQPVQAGLLAFAALAGLLLMIPSGSVVRGFLPDFLETLWGQAADLITTLLIIVALLASFILLFKLTPSEEQEGPARAS
jgi:energy-coupling factor transporter transmembrane protein EcfT